VNEKELPENTFQPLSRRNFLQLGTLVAGSTILAACVPAGGQPAAAPAQQSEPAAAEPAQEEAAPAPPGDEAVEVTAWAHWEQGLDWIDNALGNYGWKDEHPNITMNDTVGEFM
jgi:hypothetical protein